MNFSYFSDSFISKFTLFSIGVIVGGYFCRTTQDALLFGFVFAICASELYLYAIGKRDKRTRKPKHYDAVCKTLLHSGDEYALSLVYEVLKTKRSVFNRKRYLHTNKTVFICRMRPDALSPNEVSEIINFARSHAFKKLVLFCLNYSSSCSSLLQNTRDISVKIVDGYGIYNLLKTHGALPEIEIPTRKQKLLHFYQKAFDKSRAKSYFLCATTLFFASTLVRASIYYLVSACIVLTIGLCSLFLPRKKKE